MSLPSRKRIWIEAPGGGERACAPEELATRYQPGAAFRVESWQIRVDRLIREAELRGEFDNLPGAGQPLDLADNPYEQDWATAHRLMKNAGVAPPWVEREKEIRARREVLDRYLDQASQTLDALRAEHAHDESDEMCGPGTHDDHAGAPTALAEQRGTVHVRSSPAAGLLRHLWWALLQWRAARRCRTGGRGAAHQRDGTTPVLAARSFRERARAAYLKMAGELDQCIDSFNAELPRGLSWLAKPRLPGTAAAAIFDARCPPTGTIADTARGAAPAAVSQ